MRKRHRKKIRATTKKQAQRIHAKKRFLERYRLDFTKELRREFVRIIQDGRARCLATQSNRISIFSVPYEGRWFEVVYDKTRHQVVTCLPEYEAPAPKDLQETSSQP